VQAVIVLVDGMFFQERKRIAQLAASARLSAVYGFREHVDAGGLISYDVNLADNFRRAATYVVKILKGAKPGDLAVEFPNKLELIINLKTSKALGGRPFADTCQRPLCAKARNRCAIARCAGSPTASAVTGGKIVKTQTRCALVRPLRRCGLSANMVVTDRTVRNSAPEMRKAASASSRI
jgi:hypothetical protein